MAATASLKNRGGNRGRFTPNQLVIGQNPRVPHELLSDDPADEVGMQELIRDNADLDSPAKAFKHSVQIRDHARMLMETDTARERSRSAGRAQLHRDRSYHRGQWVCLAKGSAWRERSNWGSSALSVGAPGTRRSSRWYHRVGIDARTTLEVRAKADAGSDQPRVIGCRVPDSIICGSCSRTLAPRQMKTRHGTSNPGNTFFPTGKQSARNSARIDEDESDDRDRVQPSSVPSPRTRQHDCHDRTLERDHDRRRRLPKPDPIVTKAISSSTTTHPLSDLYDGAAPTREQLHSFLDLDTVSERTEESGLADPKRPQISEFLANLPSEGGASSSAGYPKALPNASEDATHVAVDSVNRNKMLDFG